MEGCIMIVIVYCLFIVVDVDWFLFVEKGEIIGCGIYYELMVFYDFYRDFVE